MSDTTMMDSPDDLDSGILNDLLGHLLRHAFNRGQAVFAETFEADGITPLQFMMLELISQNPGITHSQIGRSMGTSASVVTTTLKPLIAAGRIASTASAEDRRMVCYCVTRQGSAWFSRLRPKIDQCENRLAEGLTQGERAALTALLRRVCGVGEAAASRSRIVSARINS